MSRRSTTPTIALRAAFAAALVLASLPAAPTLADDAPAPPSRIVHVVVYPNHAQVTREIEVDARQGENTVRFTGLVPILNTKNLRATAPDGIRITGTETKSVYLSESLTDEIRALDREIESLSDRLAVLNQETNRWNEERAFYASVKERVGRELGKELSENRITVEQWESMLEFVRDGLQKCDTDLARLARESREITRQLDSLGRKRADYVARQPKEMKEVAVTFVAEEAGKKRVRIHYIVPSAGWRPVYDVHLDREGQTVQIVGYGNVIQSTGESWDKVGLTLAMSRPDFELSLPSLEPLVVTLDAQAMQQLANDINVLNEIAPGQAEEWSQNKFQGRQQEKENFRRNLEQLLQVDDEQLGQYGLNPQLIECALSRLVDRFAGVRYEVEQAETIPCDSSPHKVVVFSAVVPVDLKYVATPALGSTIVLKGDVRNLTGHPILEGDISVFIDNSYVGASKITSAAQNEGISFCFGPDDSLTVERKLVERTEQGPEAFRKSQIITYRYRITLENFRDRQATVIVVDQIPRSKSPEVQVQFLESNLAHEFDETTGEIRWTAGVEPGKRTEIDFSFSVECPVGRTVSWQ